jgi:hypothetical protein
MSLKRHLFIHHPLLFASCRRPQLLHLATSSLLHHSPKSTNSLACTALPVTNDTRNHGAPGHASSRCRQDSYLIRGKPRRCYCSPLVCYTQRATRCAPLLTTSSTSEVEEATTPYVQAEFCKDRAERAECVVEDVERLITSTTAGVMRVKLEQLDPAGYTPPPLMAEAIENYLKLYLKDVLAGAKKQAAAHRKEADKFAARLKEFRRARGIAQ